MKKFLEWRLRDLGAFFIRTGQSLHDLADLVS